MLPGFRHAEIETLLDDVLHDDGHAFQGGLIGDSAAHDAGAEHGRRFHFGRSGHEFFCLLRQELFIEKYLHEVGAYRAAGKFQECLVFLPQGAGPVEARTVMHQLHGGKRRRIVWARFRGNHGLGGIECDL